LNIQIEAKGSRRIIETDGFKIYGSDVELKQIADSIQVALAYGLVQGWVGVGADSNAPDAFPFNGSNIPTKDWEDK